MGLEDATNSTAACRAGCAQRVGSRSRLLLRALAGSLVPLLLSAATARGAIRESLERYRSGDRYIRIECFAPKARGPHPAVFLLYGSGGMEYGSGQVYRGVVRALAAKGYVAMIPHIFDASEHVVGAQIKTGEPEAWQAAVRDAIAYAATRRDVDPDRIGLFGYSMGSNLAFAEAARDSRIKAIVSLSGNIFMSRRAKLPPILILHGSDDAGSPVASIKAWDEKLTENEMPHELHIYEGVGHNFDSIRFADVTRRAGIFFDKYLKKPKKPVSSAKSVNRSSSGAATAADPAAGDQAETAVPKAPGAR